MRCTFFAALTLALVTANAVGQVFSIDGSGNVTSNGSVTTLSGGIINSSGTAAGTLSLSGGSAPAAPASNTIEIFAPTSALLTTPYALVLPSATPSTSLSSVMLVGPLSGSVSTLTFATAPAISAASMTNFPIFNQNTTGSAAKWTTARNLAGNSVDGSANVAFSNAFVAEGTSDSGLSGAQFLGSLGTGILKNTTSTGVLSIATVSDFPTLNQNTTGNAATATTASGLSGSPNITVSAVTASSLNQTAALAFWGIMPDGFLRKLCGYDRA